VKQWRLGGPSGRRRASAATPRPRATPATRRCASTTTSTDPIACAVRRGGSPTGPTTRWAF